MTLVATTCPIHYRGGRLPTGEHDVPHDVARRWAERGLATLVVQAPEHKSPPLAPPPPPPAPSEPAGSGPPSPAEPAAAEPPAKKADEDTRPVRKPKRRRSKAG